MFKAKSMTVKNFLKNSFASLELTQKSMITMDEEDETNLYLFYRKFMDAQKLISISIEGVSKKTNKNNSSTYAVHQKFTQIY